MSTTTTFAFLPRVVSKHAKPWQGISRFSPSPSPSPDPTDAESDDGTDTEPSFKGNGKERVVEAAQSKQSTLAQDIVSLISLALSDYNIWLDPDLRSKLDACLNGSDPAGFVPINYLLRRPLLRGSFPFACWGTSQHSEPSETDVVKALRTHASHILEVRMRLPSTTSSVWYGAGKTSRKKDVGGYEVRRKDWLSLRARPSREWTRARWDDMTIYMEGIPPSYRTLGGIARLAETLLPLETDPPRLRIQHVSLPPHYLDKPGDVPNCKGYALVTFLTLSDTEALLHAWPWTRRHESASKDEDASQTVKDALKYGLRAISKARWDALNEEYLVYKQSLIGEINASTNEMHPEPYDDEQRQQQSSDELQTQRVTTVASSYPFDCLVFVRNVHPETNKTTLKALFRCAFQDHETGPSQGQTELDGAGLDYVDFNKGMNTCYLRLASPQHAAQLIAYFGARDIAQADGLDAVGRTPTRDERPIALELVQGTKEALYWDKVPEKVRRQAVHKVVKACDAQSSSFTTHANDICSRGQKKRARAS